MMLVDVTWTVDGEGFSLAQLVDLDCPLTDLRTLFDGADEVVVLAVLP